jgi:hypothetical protein
MILRRIIAHFRKQEWTAIAIDFVIVVVGVFVGIQVSNWNGEQADRRRGAEYVERLSRDMEIDLAARRGEVAYYEAVLDSVLRANALLADARSNPEALSARQSQRRRHLSGERARRFAPRTRSPAPDGAMNARASLRANRNLSQATAEK